MSPSRFLTFFLLLVAWVCFLVLWWKTKLFEQIINGASLIALRLVLFFEQKFTDDLLQQRLWCCFFEGKLAISPFFNLWLLGKTWGLESSSSFRLKPCAWCVHHHHGFSESSRKIIFWWKKNINPITDSKLAKSLCHQATQGLCKKAKVHGVSDFIFYCGSMKVTLKCRNQVVSALVETPKGTCFFPLYSVLPWQYQSRVSSNFERMQYLKHLFHYGVTDLWKKLRNAKNR